MINPTTNAVLTITTVNYGGANYTAPVYLSKPPGTILNVTAMKTGYTAENKVLTVYDASGTATQKIVFLMSATLVSIPNITLQVCKETRINIKKTNKYACLCTTLETLHT